MEIDPKLLLVILIAVGAVCTAIGSLLNVVMRRLNQRHKPSELNPLSTLKFMEKAMTKDIDELKDRIKELCDFVKDKIKDIRANYVTKVEYEARREAGTQQ